MHSGNYWGGSLEVDDGRSQSLSADWEKAATSFQDERQILHNNNNNNHLNETQKSWLLEPKKTSQKKKYVNLGCVVCSRKALKLSLSSFVLAFLVIALPIIIVKTLPNPKPRPVVPDHYTLALHKALLFFNAQKSGKLGKSNGISWRGDSGLSDGKDIRELKEGLVGGYYDGGSNIKFHFPMAYSLTMLSWSLIEYSHKYQAIDEYQHARQLIKWGTDYLLLTFNSTATNIDKIYCQVGGSNKGSHTQEDDEYCWQRPEDMKYSRTTQTCNSGPDLAAEMAAALAAASIVFQDNDAHSTKLIKGAQTLYAFARDTNKRQSYSRGNPFISPYYNSTGYYDEYMWGAAWLYYATGNTTYLSLATNAGFPKHAKAFSNIPKLTIPSWDNKLPSVMLLLTRLRILLDPGYPFEEMLSMYHQTTTLNMCSYLQRFQIFNFTRAGLILLDHDAPKPLQYAANAAFLASLFSDYMDAIGVFGFDCGSNYISLDVLRTFATSQVDYILGKNPMKMSYIVGYGNKFPRQVHHRGASIPSDHKLYSCTGGFKWRDSPKPNPHNITGAMVGGPDQFDRFKDVRSHYNYTEPTLASNAGLVAALASLTTTAGIGIDKNTMFSAIPPLGPHNPPPPPPWKP